MIFGPNNRIMTIAINNVNEESYSMREYLEPFFHAGIHSSECVYYNFLNLLSKAHQLHAIVQS